MRLTSTLIPLLCAAMAGTAFAAAPAAVTTAAASTAANPVRGRVLSRTCAFCHGVENYTIPYPTRHVPLIGGQNEPYIEAAIKEYAEGHRDFATMQAQGASLTPDQIRDIAAYISGLGPNPPPTNNNQKAPAFAATCAACHGARGVSTEPGTPSLAGQFEDYLLISLKEYKSGKRKNAIMNGMASSLTLEQMKQLAHYFSMQKDGPLRLMPLPGPK
ncbi:MAG: c-type cytochrome [Gammaproteobacteria bacterium]